MSSGPASAWESETFGQDASFRLEQPIGSMSISPSGRDVVLASKEGLHIIDLDSPYSPPRYLPHRTPWEVADVQWSPFAVRDYWVVSTSNQKALVWNLAAKGWQDTIEHVLHGHSRAITDINFSAHNPDILATCAVDSFVHCWDLRAPARPAFSFSDWFAGATQVKWSRQDEHVVASSHDKFLHIWDKRHGAQPVRTIEAHGTKIYGVDWNRFDPTKLVTCSLDRTVKFWDTKNPEDIPERVIETPFPVWRARHTPFGWGLLAMPQRGSNDLFLYDRRPVDNHFESGHVQPVAKFPGHEGQVKEFLWRARGTIADGVDHRDFQLVSWGTDRELRLHRVEPETFERIGYEKGVSKTQRLNFTRRGAKYKTFRDIPEDSLSPVEPHPRGDGMPFQSQFLSIRQRNSTSVGMSKVPVSQFRGWVAGGRKATRIGMHGKGNNRNEINPIAWLKNVKITSWDQDTLAEEIRHVGEKFKKVDFEIVNIQHRKAIMSLQAPWGENQNSVYLRVEMRFPKLYPRGANAVITVQKSSGVDDTVHKALMKDLQRVSEAYASRKRGCLEAILRYLLREQSLDQIVNWVLGESLIESKILDTETVTEEESSDSDDDQLEGANVALISSANVRVPIAKGCGALWSESGKLVCFFPPPSKEPASMLGMLSKNNTDDNQSSRLFEGFGRLHAHSPARKPGNGTRTAGSDSDSDSSDDSLESSETSSSSSEPATELYNATLPYSKDMPGLPPRSPNRSNRSTTIAGTKLGDTSRHTIVSIHQFDDLLPARKDLAQRYKILGDNQDICSHNAKVARDIGRDDLASVWTLASMILGNNVPLEAVKHPTDDSEPDILIIAKRASEKAEITDVAKPITYGRLRWGASPLGAMYLIPALYRYFDLIGDVQMLAMLSCIFVESPIFHSKPLTATVTAGIGTPQKRDLVNSYFPSSAVAESLLQLDAISDGYVLIPQLINHQATPSSSSQGRSSAGVPVLSMIEGSGDGIRTQRTSRAPSMAVDDTDITSALSISDSPEGARATQRSSLAGPYSSAHASLAALTQSYSNSPPTHGGISGIPSSLKKYSPSSSLTPGWVSGSIFSGGTSGRAPRASFNVDLPHHDRDTSLRSSTSLAQVRSLRRDGRITPDNSRRSVRSRAPSEASDHTRRNKPSLKRKNLKTSLHNQDCFDLDSYAPVSLLDPSLEWRVKAYRAGYAHLLDVWQLHNERAELLKFDGVSLGATTTVKAISDIPRRKTLVADTTSQEYGLQLRRTCRNCLQVLAPIEKNSIAIGWHCVNAACISNSNKVPKRNVCSICCKPVQGLSIPCLQCGHMTCYDCAKDWFALSSHTREDQSVILTGKVQRERRSSSKSAKSAVSYDYTLDDDESTEQTRTCPTGCGCSCPDIQSINVPFPSNSRQSSHRNSVRGPLARTASHLSAHSDRLMSENGPDTAIGAFLALASLSRTRSKSSTTKVAVNSGTGPVDAEKEHDQVHTSERKTAGPSKGGNTANSSGSGEGNTKGGRGGANAANYTDLDELNPWAGSKIASLGRGIGAGLSRGLSTKGSDSTIRKVTRE